MSNELSNLNELFGGGALSTQTADELREVESMSQASSFLQRLQLYSKAKSGPNGQLISAGHFGLPLSAEEIKDLGNAIDVLVVARKAKAIDMSDTDNIIVSNEVNSDEFKRIVDLADNTRDSGCAYGPTYLVFERSTGGFYEFFCGNKSARFESSKINSYLPVTPAMIEAGVTDETEPRGPKPMHLASKFVKKGKWEWFAPTTSDCLTPFEKLPTGEQLKNEIERFLKKEKAEVEVVDEKASGRSRRSR